MFRDELHWQSQHRQSRLILALDEFDGQKAFSLLEKAAPHLLAVKVHPEGALFWGMTHADVVKKIKALVPFVILDAKLADIGNSNHFKADYYFRQGYDAIICHGFPGKDSVQNVQKAANGKGVFLLCAMTSPGHLFTDEVALELAEMAQELDVDGIIAPGNQYNLLAKIHSAAPAIPIASPGIGKQGGDAKKAAENGTRYAIVG
ncbi:MAG: orotidine-5'-phosphate decarboxylase, partial [Candidatus Micrarchaeota archaeon]|nr:orotidine-5'-phosphate decarboxylase [Candidatus Micrarchaeota archaeon]